MAVISIQSQSIEGTTVTLTNGGSSDKTRLFDRDLRALGVDVTSSSSTVSIVVDFGAATTIDYFMLGNLTSSAACVIEFYEWNGSSYDLVTTNSGTFTNKNFILTVSPVGSRTKYKIDLNPDASSAFSVANIFMGEIYTFPVNYQFVNDVITSKRYEVNFDVHGYPNAHIINSTPYNSWDIVFRLTAAQLTDLQAELANIDYGAKPFFFFDGNVDVIEHLVKWVNGPELRARNLAADFFEVNLQLEELL